MNDKLRQTQLPVRVEVRTVLVTLDTVRATLRADAEYVQALVDNGELRWVFNLAVNANDGRRDLRFFAGEIIAPDAAANLTPDAVINGILGKGETLRCGQIEREWVCSHQHVHALIKAGELTLAEPQKITRASLAAFLTRRLQS